MALDHRFFGRQTSDFVAAPNLFFARAFDVLGHRLDGVGRQFLRNHLILALGNGVSDLFIDVALPEPGEAKIAGFGVEGRGHGAIALPLIAMAGGTFLA